MFMVLCVIDDPARLERRIWFIELDALALFIIYLSGMWLLYQKGLG